MGFLPSARLGAPLLLVGALVTATAAPVAADPAPTAPPGTPVPFLELWDGAECGTITPVPLDDPTDVSDDGVVVGADQRGRATSWDARTGTYRWYGGLGGGLDSTIHAVSPQGRIAGQGYATNGTQAPIKAFRIEGSLPLRAVDRDPSSYDRVRDVNDANVVVGHRDVLATGAVEAWVWTDRRHVLPVPPGPYSFPDAATVNEAGWIAGTAYYDPVPDSFSGRRRALLWGPDRTVVEIPELADGATFVPVHIDEQGRVTGTRKAPDGRGDAVVVWSLQDGFQVAPLPPAEGRRMSIELTAVNDAGDAVGVAVDVIGSDAIGFRYRPSSGFHVVGLPGGPVRGLPYALNGRDEALVAMGDRHYVLRRCP